MDSKTKFSAGILNTKGTCPVLDNCGETQRAITEFTKVPLTSIPSNVQIISSKFSKS